MLDEDEHGNLFFWLIVAVLLICLAIAAVSKVSARDLSGRYVNSGLKPWFDSLRSGKGPCCSDADGSSISDADWEAKGGHYRVRLPRSTIPGGNNEPIWVDVPDDAVITEPNLAGRTMVWPIYEPMGISIRCFIPGGMI